MKIQILSATLAAILLWGCDDSNVSGTNDETTSTVAVICRPDGRPAAGARVLLYAASDTQTAARAVGVVDQAGHVVLPSAQSSGWYNMIVRGDSGTALFQDSLLSDGKTLAVFSDTLRRTGTLKGRVTVQPQDKPTIAWVQLLGAGRYANVDDSGNFVLDSLPSGRFTLVVRTLATAYTPTFVAAHTISDSVVDLGTISLVYTGIKMVPGLSVRWDSLGGTASLKWTPLTDSGILGYAVYRGSTSDPSAVSRVAYVTSTHWTDTLFAGRMAHGSLGGLYDSVQARVFYRVVGVTSQAEGPMGNADSLDVRSPMLVNALAPTWAKGSLPSGANPATLDSLGSGLGVLVSQDSFQTLWTSADGVSWSRGRTLAARTGAVFWKGKLWWTSAKDSGSYLARRNDSWESMCGKYVNDTTPRVASVEIHRYDGSSEDSSMLDIESDTASNVVLVPGANSIVLVAQRRYVSNATCFSYHVPSKDWSSVDGVQWSLDADSSASWWYRAVHPPYLTLNGTDNSPDIRGDNTAASILVVFGGSRSLLVMNDLDVVGNSSRVAAPSDLSRPADLHSDALASEFQFQTVPAITDGVGADSTFFLLAGGNIRRCVLGSLADWHQVQAPASSLAALRIWRGQFLAASASGLWMTPLPR